MRWTRVAALFCSLTVLAVTAGQAAAVEPTNAGDDLRTGWYPDEPSITPQLVGSGSFGELWSAHVEGQVYAQPLLDAGTLLVATEQNHVYGLDPATGAEKWSETLNGTPFDPGEYSCSDLTPAIGVTSTPVIDPATSIAYLTHKGYISGSSGPSRWYMDAIDMASGHEQPGFPVALEGSAQNAPAQSFEARTELQRPGLLLLEGVVYAAFGSDCDHVPWQGWVFGVSTDGAVTARWVADATGNGAGIWQSGAGLTSDGPGTILLSTGNGGAPAAATPGEDPPADLGESIVRLTVQSNGSLEPSDFFAPYDAASLDEWDADFASGGVTGLPGGYFGTPEIPHLAVAVGKDGYVYLLDRDHLGGIGQGPQGSDEVVQRIGPYGGVWSRPGVWPGEGGWVYIPTASGGTSAGGSAGNLRVYKYGLSGTGKPSLALQATSSDGFGFGSGSPVITSDGTTPGSALVWIVWSANGSGVGSQLRAYDPVPVGGVPVLRFSAPVGTATKFSTPGVGGGRLFVGTREGQVLAFGSPVDPPLSGSATTFPVTTVGESSQRTLTLTASEALTLSSLESSSSQFRLGALSQALPAALSSGATITVPVSFFPTGAGPQAATLTATTTTGARATFAVSGTGQTAGPTLEAVPPLVTFGGTAIGAHASAGATFRNVGGAPLTIEKVNPPEAPFEATGLPSAGSTIAPGGSLTITVGFDPTAAGTFGGQIELETSAGARAIGLSGSAASPGSLQVEDESVEYGPVPVGTTQTRSFEVSNGGGTALTITKSKPPLGGDFEATSALSEGTTLEPGQSLTETVAFTPSEAGAHSDVWSINANASPGVREVRLGGVGYTPAIALAPPLAGQTPGAGASLPTVQLVQSQSIGGPIGTAAVGARGPATAPGAKLTARALSTGPRGTIKVRLSCPTDQPSCRGTIVIRTLPGSATVTRAHGRDTRGPVVTIAAGSFDVPGGRAATIGLRLTKPARVLLARTRALQARATLVSPNPGGSSDASHVLVWVRGAGEAGARKARGHG